MITTEEIKRRLWDGANELRGSMDASRYKDYMLGLMFYKFLSDKTLDTFRNYGGYEALTEKELIAEYTNAFAEVGDMLKNTLQTALGYYVLPEYLYHTWLANITKGDFEVQTVIDSLSNFERTIAVSGDGSDFKGLFSSSNIDLSDTALGSNLNERSKNIKALIQLFADLDMVALQKGDVLGDSYEYLIGQFAMESGKKAGEFYTPHQVSEVMAQIVSKTSNIKSIYDPTVGSGSLLLTVKKHLTKDAQSRLSYYGQEKNTATYNLSRMNLLLHGVLPNKMTIKNGDTLSQDWPEDPSHPNEGVQFDAVVMNPPYSVKNWNKSNLKVNDPRFEVAGTLPPDSKGDFAFLLHGLFHLGQQGTMAIVLPHGVLFRGSSEGDIRERLLEKNYIDTIIGLPSNLFANTGIPVVIIVLKKNRQLSEPVLVIDASKSFIKVGKQNALQEKDIAKIVDTYAERRVEKGYSHLATREQILENQYNLNIPRYVEALDSEVPHDVDGHIYGGIPIKNIEDLKILQSNVPDVLASVLKEKRPGYMEIIKSDEEIVKMILSDERIVSISKLIETQTNAYIQKYWQILKTVNSSTDLSELKEDMLIEIKNMLSTYAFVDIYDGYQIIAEIWKNALVKDIEMISNSSFYTLGRTREPNMVTKGTGDKKRIEQDGWVGCLVPNDLLAKQLYSAELEAIENKKIRVQEIDAELSELIEAAKEEDSEVGNVLGGMLNEAGDAFENSKIKVELKKAQKGTIEYTLLKKAEDLFTEKATLNKDIKTDEKALKEAVQDRILTLTDIEIDNLMYEKWFGGTVSFMVNTAENPIKAELKTLQMLHHRYIDTLSDIDTEISDLEKVFEALMSELVVGE